MAVVFGVASFLTTSEEAAAWLKSVSVGERRWAVNQWRGFVEGCQRVRVTHQMRWNILVLARVVSAPNSILLY